MLKTLLISLALLAMAATLAVGGGHRGMGDGGLRFSAGVTFAGGDLTGFGDGASRFAVSLMDAPSVP